MNCIMNSLTKVVCTTRNYHICILFCLEEQTKGCKLGRHCFSNINFSENVFTETKLSKEEKFMKSLLLGDRTPQRLASQK